MIIQSFLGTVNWGVVGWVLVGAIAFIIVVAAVGRAIAAVFPPSPEHVSSFRKPKPVVAVPAVPVAAPATVSASAANVPAQSADAISPEIMAVIAASVAVVLQGKRYAITGVSAQKAPDIEQLMSLWSLEGRRQVYSSHVTR